MTIPIHDLRETREALGIEPDDFDDYRRPKRRPDRRAVNAILAVITLFAVAAYAWAALAETYTFRLVVHACKGSECHTVSVPVPNCTAGGQAWLVRWWAENPTAVVRAWKCVNGEVA